MNSVDFLKHHNETLNEKIKDKSQLKIIKKFLKQGYETGTNTKPANKAEKSECEKAIASFYNYGKKTVPKHYIWVKSPHEAQTLINNFDQLANDTDDVNLILKRLREKKLPHKFVNTNFWGQLDMYWIGFYLCGKKLGCEYPEKDLKQLINFETIAKACSWWWPFENVVIISEKPISIKLKSPTMLHADGCAAYEFCDGFKIWA